MRVALIQMFVCCGALTAVSINLICGDSMLAGFHPIGHIGSITTCTAWHAADEQDANDPLREVQTISGRRFPATLVSIDEQWNMTVENEARQLVLTPDEFYRWGLCGGDLQTPLIVCRDGSQIAAEIFGLDQNGLRVASRQWAETTIPLDCLQAVLLQPPADDLELDRLLIRLTQTSQSHDQVVLDNLDDLQCIVLASQAAVQGAPSGPTGFEYLQVQLAQGVVDLERDRVLGWQWSDALAGGRAFTEGRAMIGFRDATSLQCQRVTQRRDHLEFELACGVKLTTRPRQNRNERWREISSIVLRQDRFDYLSQLEPAQYQLLPAWDRAWNYEMNRSVVGGRLRWQNGYYLRGVGMHAASNLAFVLDGKYKRFRSDAAIDRSAGLGGSVVFRVYRTDDGERWQSVYESIVVRGGDAPVPIDLDIAGAYAITISVDFADGGVVLDRANWLDARFEK